MDENEYRSVYHSINDTRCVFEKSILTLNCKCRHHEKFNLAEREGIRCTNPDAQNNCSILLNETRKQARFALGLSEIVGNLLPHNKEIRLQKGTLLGLKPDLPNLPDTAIKDIYSLVERALDECSGNMHQFPFHTLIPSISHHPVQQRRHRSNKKTD
jgi:hypothetical protein